MSDKFKEVALKYFIALVVITLNIVRKPELLYQPRFFAEEGANFFQQAYNTSFVYNLLNPQFGYYTLYNVLATSLATVVNLEYAPLITTYAALIIQVIISIYVIWSDIPALNSQIKRYIVAMSFPLLCPGQIWLTTIGVQYWLTVLSFLILLEGSAFKLVTVHYLKAMVLTFNGMTGVLTCFMLPIFLYKYIKTKSKQFILYSAVLCGCSILQFAIYMHAYLRQDPGLINRFVTRKAYLTIYDSLATLLCTFTLTPSISSALIHTDTRVYLDNVLTRLAYPIELRDGESIIVITSIFTLAFIVPLIIKLIKDTDMTCMTLSVTIVYSLSVLFSVNSIGGDRYVYAPSIMLFIFIIASSGKKAVNGVYKYLITSFAVIVIVTHGFDFRKLSMSKSYNDSWPKWEQELRVWKMNEYYPLRIWPPPWVMNLKKKEERPEGSALGAPVKTGER